MSEKIPKAPSVRLFQQYFKISLLESVTSKMPQPGKQYFLSLCFCIFLTRKQMKRSQCDNIEGKTRKSIRVLTNPILGSKGDRCQLDSTVIGSLINQFIHSSSKKHGAPPFCQMPSGVLRGNAASPSMNQQDCTTWELTGQHDCKPHSRPNEFKAAFQQNAQLFVYIKL